MRGLVLTILVLLATPAAALNEGLQCVPYARALSGVEIRGDAHTWWGQAAGRYDRGDAPRVGAVLSFIPHGKMRLGHVAAVSKVIDDRTILVSHANWSTINGVRGHIENNVRVLDVSPDNDWSRVRVWYSPLAQLGTTEWPAHGFIYPQQKRSDREVKMAVASLLGGKAMPSSASVWNAVAMKPQSQKIATVKTSFALSGSLLKELDKKADKEERDAKAANGKKTLSEVARHSGW